MPDGEFRRPPRLWEEQLQATVDVQSVGISSLAASTVPTVTMPDPGGVAADPAPPAYADIATAPAAPTLVGIIAGLNVTWTGLDVSGNAYPAGMYAEVHVSSSTGFTPSSGTLKATLSRPGTTTVTGLTAGTTYYAKVIVVDEQGQRSPASAQASAAAGFVSTGQYGTASIGADSISFDARAIGGITTTVGSTTPTSPKDGDIWLDNSALSKALTSAAASGASIVYTASGHPFAVADTVTITGASGSGFNRAGTITAADASTFTVGIDALAVSAKQLTSNVATLTTSAAHNLAIGWTVVVAGVDATFNGTYTVASTPSATTFTYARTASNVGYAGASGTVTVSAATGSATGGTAVGPVRGMTQKRYNGSAWVVSDWGPDMLSANVVTAKQIAAGAITAGAIVAGAITAKLVGGEVIRTTAEDTGARVRISSAEGVEVYSSTERVFQAKPDGTVTVKGAITSGSTITGATVSGGTISGATIVTNSGNGGRIRMVDASSTPLGTYDAIEFYSGGTVRAYVLGASGGLNCFADNVYFSNKANTAYAAVTTGPLTVSGSLDTSSPVTLGYSGINRAFRIDASGNVYSYGIEAATAGGTANVNCAVAGDRQLRIQTSTVRIKTDVRALGDGLVGVPADKLGARSDIDAAAVLTLTPVDFESLVDDGQRYVGFIAEDVAAKLPQAAEYDANGEPRNVDTRAVLACLLQVVKDQQAQIADLTARVEALEG